MRALRKQQVSTGKAGGRPQREGKHRRDANASQRLAQRSPTRILVNKDKLSLLFDLESTKSLILGG